MPHDVGLLQVGRGSDAPPPRFSPPSSDIRELTSSFQLVPQLPASRCGDTCQGSAYPSSLSRILGCSPERYPVVLVLWWDGKWDGKS